MELNRLSIGCFYTVNISTFYEKIEFLMKLDAYLYSGPIRWRSLCQLKDSLMMEPRERRNMYDGNCESIVFNFYCVNSWLHELITNISRYSVYIYIYISHTSQHNLVLVTITTNLYEIFKQDSCNRQVERANKIN